MPDASEIGAITRPLERLGIALPSDVLRLRDAWANVTLPDATAALVADLDTLTADNVQTRLRAAAVEQAARQAAGPLAHRLGQSIAAGIITAIRGDAERIIGELRDRLAPAAEVVAAAVPLVDPRDGPQVVLDKGEKSAAAYIALREANVTLELVHDARVHLSRVAGFGPVEPYAALFVPAADVPTLAHLRHADRLIRDPSAHGRWLRTAAAGFGLTVNDGPAAQALVAAATEQTRKEKEAAQRPRATALQ